MPTYEYVCNDCGEPLEVVQSIHEPSLTECPACGGRLRKVFGNVGVVFKGSGFYRTDSRSKSAKSGGAKAGSGKAAGDSKPADSGSTSSSSTSTSGSSSSGGSTGSSSTGTSASGTTASSQAS